MTDHDAHPQTNRRYPAPPQNRVADWLLIFSFLLAPVVWGMQLAAISSLSGLACSGLNAVASERTAVTWAEPASQWITVAALLLGVVGIVLCLLNMRRSRQAGKQSTGRADSADKGRAYWMAFGGLFVALVSTIAIIAHAIPVFWGGLCSV